MVIEKVSFGSENDLQFYLNGTDCNELDLIDFTEESLTNHDFLYDFILNEDNYLPSEVIF